MTSFTRLILALLLIGVAAIATAAMRDAGWITLGGMEHDGPWGPIAENAPAAPEIDITAEEALAISRFLDQMLGHGT